MPTVTNHDENNTFRTATNSDIALSPKNIAQPRENKEKKEDNINTKKNSITSQIKKGLSEIFKATI